MGRNGVAAAMLGAVTFTQFHSFPFADRIRRRSLFLLFLIALSSALILACSSEQIQEPAPQPTQSRIETIPPQTPTPTPTAAPITTNTPVPTETAAPTSTGAPNQPRQRHPLRFPPQQRARRLLQRQPQRPLLNPAPRPNRSSRLIPARTPPKSLSATRYSISKSRSLPKPGRRDYPTARTSL